MSLEKIFTDAGLKYPIINSSLGRLEHLGMFGTQYGLNLNHIQLVQLGEIINQRINTDFDECYNIVNDILNKVSNTKLKPFPTINFFMPLTEYDHLENLAIESRLIDRDTFTSETIESIENIIMGADPEIKNKARKPINHRVLIGDEITQNLIGNKDIPIAGIIFSKKHPESMVCKLLNNNGKIINPLKEDIITYFNDLNEYSELSPSEIEERKQYIFQTTFKYFKEVFNSGEEFYYHHYKKIHDFEGLNQIYFQKLANIFLVDAVRAKIIVETEEDVEHIDEIMKTKFPKSDGSNYGILPGRVEYASELKGDRDKISYDGSSTFGIGGEYSGTYCEIKVQDKKSFIEGEIGGSPDPKILPHWQYGCSKFAKTPQYVKGNTNMTLAGYIGCEMHKLSHEKLFKCGLIKQ